jgi:excisionase family DNA binding protein
MERTLTLAEAAEATGLTRKALQRRVDRGSVRSVLTGGLRRIPVTELYRLGLMRPEEAAGPSAPSLASGPVAPAPRGPGPGIGELLDRLERQAQELGEMRALSRQAESLLAQAEAERRARQAAETALFEARARIAELEALRAAGGLRALAREVGEAAQRAWRARAARRRRGAPA